MKKTEKKSLKNSLVQNTTAIESCDYDIIRESLLLQKSEILNRSNEFKTEQSQFAKFSDDADQTVQELQNNVSIHLHERERKSLLIIEKILTKFFR